MYIRIVNNAPQRYTLGELRRDNPQVSFPESMPTALLADFDVYPLQPAQPPNPDPLTEKVVEGTPEQVNGEWVQRWELVSFTQPEAEAARMAFMQSFVDATQKRLDDFARTRQYDGILSLCTYINDTNLKFKTEGEYGVQVRGETWVRLYELWQEIENQERDIPSSFADIEAELPELVWPD
jgi:hypothetical protein